MYQSINEEARKLGYRMNSFPKGMRVTSIRSNTKEIVLGINKPGETADKFLSEMLKGVR